jgi:hypothetical protein
MNNHFFRVLLGIDPMQEPFFWLLLGFFIVGPQGLIDLVMHFIWSLKTEAA